MPIKRINTRQPVANPGCLARLTRIAKWGAGAFIALIACGALTNLAPRSPVTTPQPTAPAPTIAARSITLELPTATAIPPTATAIPPTATAIPPTATAIPPTATAIPPTATAIPPTATAIPPTATAIPPTATATTAPLRPITLENANLRQGPGTEHPIIGALNAGQELTIIARTPDYDWFQLDTGAWVAAFLVAGVPIDLPIVDKPATAPALPTTAPPIAAQPAEPPPNAFTCVGGCAVPPDPSCAIKGNVNSKGEKIYHQPGWRDYNRTDIKPEEGDLWFCTAQEAQAAGFRAPLNH